MSPAGERLAGLVVLVSVLALVGACGTDPDGSLVVEEAGPGSYGDSGPMAADEPRMTALVSRVCVEGGPVEITSVTPTGLEGAAFRLTGFTVVDEDPDATLRSLVRESIEERFDVDHVVDAACSDESRDATLYVEVTRPEQALGSFQGLKVATDDGSEIEVNYALQACLRTCP